MSLHRFRRTTLCLSLATGLVAACLAAPATARPTAEKIVNGSWSQGAPSTVALTAGGRTFCSGTLVGCSTVITAAHCVEGAPPEAIQVFAQHQGQSAALASITVHPGWGVSPGNDIAVLELAKSLDGVQPTPINEAIEIAPGSPVTKTGYGVADDLGGGGIKRTVSFATSPNPCFPGAICYEILDPETDGSACFGDSGGPMFADIDGVETLVGVTSGGTSCTPPGFAVDTDVYTYRDWLRQVAGDDLDTRSCGAVAQAGDGDSSVSAVHGYSGSTGAGLHDWMVGDGADTLDVTVNTTGGGTVRIRQGAEPTDDAFDCEITPFSGCTIDDPTGGQWFASFTGVGEEYQITATERYAVDSGNGRGGLPAAANPTDFCINTLRSRCVDGVPFDRRFEVRSEVVDPIAGQQTGYTLHIGNLRGALGYFYSEDNPELLTKILDGCAINGHFWLFTSSNTTLEHSVRILDRETGETMVLSNPEGQIATPVANLTAFPCPDSGS